jgi:xanthine dehydrogenase YagS FAD-binding subunit
LSVLLIEIEYRCPCPRDEQQLEAPEIVEYPACRGVLDWVVLSGLGRERHQASYEFVLVSTTLTLRIDGGLTRSVRLAAGGVGTNPCRQFSSPASCSFVPTATRRLHR